MRVSGACGKRRFRGAPFALRRPAEKKVKKEQGTNRFAAGASEEGGVPRPDQPGRGARRNAFGDEQTRNELAGRDAVEATESCAGRVVRVCADYVAGGVGPIVTARVADGVLCAGCRVDVDVDAETRA